MSDWGEKPIADLSEEDFADLLGSPSTSALEMVILGTGAKSRFPSRELMFAFARRGVGLEYMNTPAAARTFNVLVGEGRRVVAVLYLD